MAELDIAEQQLVDVRGAIKRVLDVGQSVGTAQRTAQMAELRQLRADETMLLGRIARLKRGGIRHRRIVPLG